MTFSVYSRMIQCTASVNLSIMSNILIIVITDYNLIC